MAKVSLLEPGTPFPAHTFKNLNRAAGGPAAIDLAHVLGKKPVVLCYWFMRNRRSEEVLRQVQDLADEIGPSRIALYAVAKQRPDVAIDAAAIQKRAGEIGIHVPILDDEGFRIGQQLGVQVVPHISVIDRGGVLRLANGGSLLHTIEYKMDLAKAIRRVAETGTLSTYGYLAKYYPANELIGSPAPDFEAPSVADGVVHSWSSLRDSRKINVLVFWSVDCPHCRKQLPDINNWIKTHSDRFNVVTAARVKNDVMKTKTREYTRLNGFAFKTLLDIDGNMGTKYKVTSTPTMFVMRPDGVVDSVLLSGTVDFASALEAKRSELLSGG